MRQVEGAAEVATGAATSQGNAGGTTLIDTGLYSSARDQFVRQGDIVCITSGSERGSRSVATGPPDSSGVITVSPAFSGQIDSAVTYQIFDGDGPHPDILDRMLDEALDKRLWRWLKTPVTHVPGGDVGEELSIDGSDDVVDGTTKIWTSTNAPATLPSLAYPDEFVRRSIHLIAGAANGYVESQALDADVDNRPSWAIHALIRAGPGADAGRIVIRDLTNNADITPDTALTWTREAWGLIESCFTIPAACEQIAIRLQCDGNGDLMDFAQIQAWPVRQTRFSLPQRITSDAMVGSVFIRRGGVFDEFRPAPWDGAVERRDAAGTGVQLVLTPAPGSAAVWFYEKDSFPKLTSATPAATDDDNTTWAVEDWLLTVAESLCYERLQRRDRKEVPGRWDEAVAQAELDAGIMQRLYGAEPMLVEDRAQPTHRAVSRM